MKRLDHHWYQRSPWLLLLWPLSLLFGLVVAVRRFAYRSGILRSAHPGVPVIIVGNLTAGGTGKTPLVAWLADHLRERGYSPGIVSRGYGGNASQWPQQVRADSDPRTVGDEAVLLARRTGCPMAVGPDRYTAARELVEHGNVDIIISDDGLQHYALQRDLEIVVIDGIRRFGNGLLLPAGPLREPAKRLAGVDLVVVNGLGDSREHPMRMALGDAHQLAGDATRRLSAFNPDTVHAVAGIGHPERFFQSLQQSVRQIDRHEFPDHHQYSRADIEFDDEYAVLMTEKDAVKCRRFASEKDWYVPVEVSMSPAFINQLDRLLDERAPRASAST